MDISRINTDIRRILAREQYLHVEVKESWFSASMLEIDGDRRETTIRRKMAGTLASEFAEYVMQHGVWQIVDEPDATRIGLYAYCYSRDKLANLLAAAYEAGAADERRRAPLVSFNGGGQP